jgi:tRNA A-37 threonylcarbamoyl transferase component Bud32
MPKQCPSGKIRNPKTGRCVNRSGRVGKQIVRSPRRATPCRSGQIRNPKTGRCVKRSGAIGRAIASRRRRARSKSKKPCTSSQIRNPKTGRCVKRTGAIGRSLVPRRRKSPSKRKSPAKIKKPCTSSQVRNPKTGRCVKRTGAIGRTLVSRSKSRGPSPIRAKNSPVRKLSPEKAKVTDMFVVDKKVKKIENIVIPNCGIQLLYVLGKGISGSTYVGKDLTTSQLVVVKTFGSQSLKQSEIDMQKLFYQHKIGAPKLLKMCSDKKGTFSGQILVMKLDPFAINAGMFSNILSRQVLTTSETGKKVLDAMIDSIDKIITRMKQYKVMHGDFHASNIGFQQTKSITHTAISEYVISEGVVISPLLIDFGWSGKVYSPFPDIDILQFIRCITPYIDKKLKSENAKYIYDNILPLITKHCVLIKRNAFPSFPPSYNFCKRISEAYVSLLDIDWRKSDCIKEARDTIYYFAPELLW